MNIRLLGIEMHVLDDRLLKTQLYSVNDEILRIQESKEKTKSVYVINYKNYTGIIEKIDNGICNIQISNSDAHSILHEIGLEEISNLF